MKPIFSIAAWILLACAALSSGAGGRRVFDTPEAAVWAAKAFVDGYLTPEGTERNEFAAYVVRGGDGRFYLTEVIQGSSKQVSGTGALLRDDDEVLFQFHSHPGADMAGASNQDYYAAVKNGTPSIVYDEKTSRLLMLAPNATGTWLYWQIQKRKGQTVAREMESWEFQEADDQRIRTLDYLATGRQNGANDAEGHGLAMPFNMLTSIVPDADGRLSPDPERMALYKTGEASPPGLGFRPLGDFVEGYQPPAQPEDWSVASTLPERRADESTSRQEGDSSSRDRGQRRDVRQERREKREEHRKEQRERRDEHRHRRDGKAASGEARAGRSSSDGSEHRVPDSPSMGGAVRKVPLQLGSVVRGNTTPEAVAVAWVNAYNARDIARMAELSTPEFVELWEDGREDFFNPPGNWRNATVAITQTDLDEIGSDEPEWDAIEITMEFVCTGDDGSYQGGLVLYRHKPSGLYKVGFALLFPPE